MSCAARFRVVVSLELDVSFAEGPPARRKAGVRIGPAKVNGLAGTAGPLAHLRISSVELVHAHHLLGGLLHHHGRCDHLLSMNAVHHLVLSSNHHHRLLLCHHRLVLDRHRVHLLLLLHRRRLGCHHLNRCHFHVLLLVVHHLKIIF